MARITGPGFFTIDQWMLQHLCQVRRKAEVDRRERRPLADAAAGRLLATARRRASRTRSRAACARYGPHPHVAVLPQGPYVLATVRGRKLSLGRAWMAA